jgi:hypothetical protein
MSARLEYMNAPSVRLFKINSDGGHSGSKKFKRGYGGACDGAWRGLRLAGVVLCWCVCKESAFNRREDVLEFCLAYKSIL